MVILCVVLRTMDFVDAIYLHFKSRLRQCERTMMAYTGGKDKEITIDWNKYLLKDCILTMYLCILGLSILLPSDIH